MMEQELKPKRKLKLTPEELEQQIAVAKSSPEFISPLRDYPPVLKGDDVLSFPDDKLGSYTNMVEQAMGIFGEDIIHVSEPTVAPAAEQPKSGWKPRDEHFIDVQGGAKYLPARRRVQWMRQEPDPHPDWTIKTEVVDFERGVIQGRNRIGGGYAQIRASLYDELGKLVSTGHAQEYSENFFDFLEKAETSAVARCLALAGYGTESALDIDEGFIADSPFRTNGQMGGDPTITIKSSNIEGLVQGGRSKRATEPQVDAIRRKARELGLEPDQLATIIGQVLGTAPDLSGVEEPVPYILNIVRGLEFDEAAAVVQILSSAVANEASA